MPHGTGSTLILRPKDLTAITFDMAAATTDGYIVNAGSLRFNEQDRLTIAYSEGAKMDGGKVANAHGPLVDVSFDVIIMALTRDSMISKAGDLIAAVTNPTGGTLQWKPEDLTAGVPDTYFQYIQSPAPGLAAINGNRWDAAPTGETPPVYTLVLTVELKTQPFPVSDPDTLTTVQASATIENAEYSGWDNTLTIPAASVKGNRDAKTQVLVTPQTSGADVGRMIIARRTEGLANFQSMYYTATFLSPASGWSTVTDATRVGGNYYTCTPIENDVDYGLRYTIANWESHKGRAALVAFYKANGEDVDDDFTIQAAWSIANTPLRGEAQEIASTREWRYLVLAEMDIPETEMSDLEDLDLYIDIFIQRTAGTGTISIDALALLYVDESIVEVTAPINASATTSHDILIEGLGNEIAHIINTSDQKLQYIMQALGSPGLLTLKAGVDNRLDVIWERSNLGHIDDFSSYSGSWRGVADFEPGGDVDITAAYTYFCPVTWRSPNPATTYPVDIVNDALDTAALVTGGKMRADGNDLRVLVDGVETDRWLQDMDDATTQVWVNLDFAAAQAFTLDGAIAGSGAVTSVTVNEAINLMPASGPTCILRIEDELYTYTGKDDGSKTFSGVTRAAYGSSMAAHIDGSDADWIQHKIMLWYGDPDASAPSTDDDYKPAFELDSTNAVHTYEQFGEDDGLRAMQWETEIIFGSPIFYTANRVAYSDPWEVAGISTGQYDAGRFYLYNPCYITSVDFTDGEKRTNNIFAWGNTTEIVSSQDGIAWIPEYVIVASALNTWEAWSRNETMDLGRIYAGIEASGGELEYADAAVTLNSTYTPVADISITTEDSADYTSYAVEADFCQPVAVSSSIAGQINIAAPIPWPFPDTSFFCFYLHLETAISCTSQTIRIRLKVDDSNYYQHTVNKSLAASSDADYFEEHQISTFSTSGSPTLAGITTIEIYCTVNAGSAIFYFDDVRLAAVDPDSGSDWNDTGDVWDNESGTWHVEEQASADKYLGQIDGAAAVGAALVSINYGPDVQFRSLCRLKSAGGAGLLFRITDATPGSEDGYIFIASTASDLLYLYSLSGGTPTSLSTATFPLSVGDDFYLGIIVKGPTIECYASTALADLWDVSNRAILETDSTHTAGQVGLATMSANGRFTDFLLSRIADRYIPADQVDIEIKAMFSTIAPFSD